MKWIVIAGAVSVFVVGLWFLSWALISQGLGSPNSPENFGDMFGAINALFTGLAFAGVIVAIFMQREDLKLQQRELTESRKAQEDQVKALVIAAQINANVAMLANYGMVQRYRIELHGEPDLPEYSEVGEIDDLLGQLKQMKKLTEHQNHDHA